MKKVQECVRTTAIKCLYLCLNNIKVNFKMFQVSLNISAIYNGILLRRVCANVNCLSCLLCRCMHGCIFCLTIRHVDCKWTLLLNARSQRCDKCRYVLRSWLKNLSSSKSDYDRCATDSHMNFRYLGTPGKF